MSDINILDLFSGLGGFSLAFENVSTRFKTKAFCEIDPHAQKVLSKNWPHVPNYSDINKLDGKFFNGKIDIVVGGPPCTDISVAGKKKGLIDENGERTRSGLWFEYKRIIEEIRPRWIVIENVRNLLSIGLATFLKDLDALGYDAEWEIISAASVGAPHLRERIWIVAYPRCAVTNSNGQSIRDQQQRPEIGRNGILTEGQTKPGNSGAPGAVMVPNPYNFRFWPSFTSEEEKSEWWTKATAKFCTRWKTESGICGVDDGLSGRLERDRRERIKRLGNSIVPPIVEIIAERILYHERKRGL